MNTSHNSPNFISCIISDTFILLPTTDISHDHFVGIKPIQYRNSSLSTIYLYSSRISTCNPAFIRLRRKLMIVFGLLPQAIFPSLTIVQVSKCTFTNDSIMRLCLKYDVSFSKTARELKYTKCLTLSCRNNRSRSLANSDSSVVLLSLTPDAKNNRSFLPGK